MAESGLDESVAEGFVRLIAEGLFDELTLLDVAGNNLSEVMFSLMCSAILDAKIPLVLEELWLGGCPIQDDGVQMLASLIRNNFMPHLHTLSIDSRRGSCVGCSVWDHRQRDRSAREGAKGEVHDDGPVEYRRWG